MRKTIKKAAAALADFWPAAVSGTELEFFARYNITNSQLISIVSIFFHHRYTMGELAGDLHVSMPTVTGLIDRLTKLKLVKRSISGQDRRKVYIELTPKGEALVESLKSLIRKKWEGFLSMLSPSEVKHFAAIIEKIKKYTIEQRADNEK